MLGKTAAGAFGTATGKRWRDCEMGVKVAQRGAPPVSASAGTKLPYGVNVNVCWGTANWR